MKRILRFVTILALFALFGLLGCSTGLSGRTTSPTVKESAIGSDYDYISGQATSFIKVAANPSGSLAYVSQDNRDISDALFGASFARSDASLAAELLFDESIVITPVELITPGAYNGNGNKESVLMCKDGDENPVAVIRGSGSRYSGNGYAIAVLKGGEWHVTTILSGEWSDVSDPKDLICEGSKVHLLAITGSSEEVNNYVYVTAEDTDGDYIYETFSDVYRVNSESFEDAGYAKMAIAGNNIYVVFVADDNEGSGYLYFNKSRKDSILFGTDILINADYISSGSFGMAAYQEGVILVAWGYNHDDTLTQQIVFYSQSTDGGTTWSAPLRMHNKDYGSNPDSGNTFLRSVGPVVVNETYVAVFWKTSHNACTTRFEYGTAPVIVDYCISSIEKGVDFYDYGGAEIRVDWTGSTLAMVVPWSPCWSETEYCSEQFFDIVYSPDNGLHWHEPDLEGYMAGIGLPRTDFYVSPYVINLNGGVVISWSSSVHDVGFGGDPVMVYYDGADFSDYQGIALPETSYQRFPDMVIDSNGNYYVVMMDNREDAGGHIYAGIFGTEGITSSTTGVKVSGDEPQTIVARSFPVIAIAPKDDRINVIYSGYPTTGEVPADLYLVYSDDNGASWSTAIRVTATEGEARPYDMIIDSNGVMYLFYSISDSVTRTTTYRFASSSDSGRTWDDRELDLSIGDGWQTIYFMERLAVDSNNVVYLSSMAYKTDDDANVGYKTVVAKSLDYGANWSLVGEISDALGGIIVIDNNDIMTIVYAEVDEDFMQGEFSTGTWHFAQSEDLGKTWKPAVLIDDLIVNNYLAGDNFSYDIAADEKGNVVFGTIKYVNETNRAYIYLIY